MERLDFIRVLNSTKTTEAPSKQNKKVGYRRYKSNRFFDNLPGWKGFKSLKKDLLFGSEKLDKRVAYIPTSNKMETLHFARVEGNVSTPPGNPNFFYIPSDIDKQVKDAVEFISESVSDDLLKEIYSICSYNLFWLVGGLISEPFKPNQGYMDCLEKTLFQLKELPKDEVLNPVSMKLGKRDFSFKDREDFRKIMVEERDYAIYHCVNREITFSHSNGIIKTSPLPFFKFYLSEDQDHWITAADVYILYNGDFETMKQRGIPVDRIVDHKGTFLEFAEPTNFFQKVQDYTVSELFPLLLENLSSQNKAQQLTGMILQIFHLKYRGTTKDMLSLEGLDRMKRFTQSTMKKVQKAKKDTYLDK